MLSGGSEVDLIPQGTLAEGVDRELVYQPLHLPDTEQRLHGKEEV